MILNELFESGMKRVMDTVQDFVELTDKEFIQRHGVSPVVWVKQNQSLLSSIADQYPTIKKYIPAPDAHLFNEEVEMVENLRKWFKEKWVRFGPDGKIRGSCARGSESEGKPKCLPQAKAHALGKKKRAAAAAKKRREDPNPERRGKAKNVATKVREQDVPEAFGLYGPFTATINTGERPQSRTKTKKFRREDDAILWAEDWLENAPQYVFATAEVTDPDGNVVWTTDERVDEKQDACYHKVKSRYKVWPSAYASGALVQCRKKGAANWGKGSKKK